MPITLKKKIKITIANNIIINGKVEKAKDKIKDIEATIHTKAKQVKRSG